MATVGEPEEQTQKCRDLVTAPVCAHTHTRTSPKDSMYLPDDITFSLYKRTTHQYKVCNPVSLFHSKHASNIRGFFQPLILTCVMSHVTLTSNCAIDLPPHETSPSIVKIY
jgi:hypothetical protein